MKRNLFLCFLCAALGCGSLQVRTSTGFSEDESALLLGMAQSISLDCSYDYDMNLWCFFSTAVPAIPPTEAKGAADEKKIADVIAKAGDAVLLSMYEKTFGNYCSMQYMKKYYHKRKQWKYYNVLNKTVVPSTEYFLYIAERALAKKNPDMKKKLDGEKSDLNKAAVGATIEQLSVVDGFN